MVVKQYEGRCMVGAKSKQTRKGERNGERKEGKKGCREERRHRKNQGLPIMPVLVLLNSTEKEHFSYYMLS